MLCSLVECRDLGSKYLIQGAVVAMSDRFLVPHTLTFGSWSLSGAVGFHQLTLPKRTADRHRHPHVTAGFGRGMCRQNVKCLGWPLKPLEKC